MSSRGGGRSARTRPQRLARRRAETRGFDRGGGGGRSIFRNRWLLIGFGVVAIIALVGGLVATVGSGPTVNPNTPPPVRRTVTEPVETGAVEGKPQFSGAPAMALEEGADYRAVIELKNGVVEIDLFEDDAPIHVNNFVFLAEQGFYDDLTFHRIVPEFVVQAGDPTAVGDGGAGYTLPDEQIAEDTAPRLTLDARGVISMARSDLGASSSQFFITLAPAGFLDTQSFTAFGTVTSGMELLDEFQERDPAAQPPDPAGPTIVSVTIERVETGAVEGKPQFSGAPAMALEEGADYRAVIELKNGVVEIDLFEDIAPVHVNNFVFLAEQGFYDDLTFHRVVPEFVAQAGDPTATGTGGAGYTLPDEQVAADAAVQLTLDARGVISMARSGLGASSSQFFITLAPAGFLDEQSFTAFGTVTSGMELLDEFAERDPAAQPPDPAGPTIVSIKIERAAPATDAEE